jgi:hypothetical protein
MFVQSMAIFWRGQGRQRKPGCGFRPHFEVLESRAMLSAANLTDWTGVGNTSGTNNYVVTPATLAGGTFAERVAPSAHLSDATLVGSGTGSPSAFDFTENLSASGTLSFTNPNNVDPNIFFGFYSSAGSTSANTQRLGIAFSDQAANQFRGQMQAVNGSAVTSLTLDTNGATGGGTQPLAAGSYAFSVSYVAATGLFTTSIGPVSYSTTLAAATFQAAGNADKLDRFGFLQLNATNTATTYALNVENINYTGESQVATGPALPGDYNDNSVVDAADFVVFRKANGTNVTLPGDTTPGTVYQADYDMWRANFGNALPAPPAAPSNLQATAISTSQIDLTWNNNSNNSNSETGFKIDRATNNTFTAGMTTVLVGADAVSYSAMGLTAGTTYYFRVRSTNAVGDSSNSNTASAATTPAEASSTFYLNLTTGNDTTGNGTVGAPWKTMEKALQMAPLVTDSTVYIAAGNYTEVQQIASDPSPTRTGKVTFKPAPGATVTLMGISENDFVQINWKNVKNVRVEGLNFNKAFVRIVDTQNFELVGNDFTAAGLEVYGADGALVDSNSFHGYTQGDAAILFRAYNTFALPGSFPRQRRADSVTIKNNICDMNNQTGDAIHIEAGTNELIQGNVIKNVATTSENHGDSIQLVEVSNSTITGNIMSGGRGIIVENQPSVPVIPSANHDLTFTNNVHTSGLDYSLRLINAPNAIVVNNTFWGTGTTIGHGLDIQADCSNVVLVNNILRVLTVRAGATFAMRSNNLINNIFLDTRVASEISGPPTFINYAAGDLRLAAGSLGINSGINGSFVPVFDFEGLSRAGLPDMGAYERQS